MILLIKNYWSIREKNFYNIGSNIMISNNEIVEKLVKLTNCDYISNQYERQFFKN